MSGVQARALRLNHYFQLYLFIYLSCIVYLFTFPLRLAALSPSGNQQAASAKASSLYYR